MSDEDRYVITDAGHTALAEAYWRQKIAKEIEAQVAKLADITGEAHADNQYVGGLLAGAKIAKGVK